MKRTKDAAQKALDRESFLETKYKGKSFRDRKKEREQKHWHDNRIYNEEEYFNNGS